MMASYAEDEIQTRYYLTPFAVKEAGEFPCKFLLFMQVLAGAILCSILCADIAHVACDVSDASQSCFLVCH